MNEHTFYVAMSYAALVAAMAFELAALALRRARARRGVQEERGLEAQD
jgi:heme exporter protein CcmD